MSGPIPLRDSAWYGYVTVEIVNALLAFGEPMVTEGEWDEPYWPPGCRVWIRLRGGGRVFGKLDRNAQLSAERLLRKLRGER